MSWFLTPAVRIFPVIIPKKNIKRQLLMGRGLWFFFQFNRPEKLGHRRVVITKAIFKQDVMSIDQMTTALGDHDFFIEPLHLCRNVSFITNSSIQMTKRREIKRSFRLISPKHVYLKS